MQVLCKEGDKFGIGNGVTLEILTITSRTVEVQVTTPEGTYVELFESGEEEVNHTDDVPTQSRSQHSNARVEAHAPVNRIKSYFVNG